jgi:hypothetical protein
LFLMTIGEEKDDNRTIRAEQDGTQRSETCPRKPGFHPRLPLRIAEGTLFAVERDCIDLWYFFGRRHV